MANDISTVAKNALTHFAKSVHPQAIRIFTPFAQRVSLSECKISPALLELLARYEPKIEEGLFPHQAEFLKAYLEDGQKDFILTTATGSGKSLCFWAWVFQQLLEDSNSTALLCFPTQALMWSQGERLARLSESASLAKPDGENNEVAYGGSVQVGHQHIAWTIWQGVGMGWTRDEVMEKHQKSDAFKSARIRIATIDKAAWSLIKRDKDFLSRLTCIVLDEAHTYDGIFGANVHYFLKRIYMGLDLLRQKPPSLLLASATLGSARKFAQTLLGLDNEGDIVHIADSTKQQIELIPAKEVPHALANSPDNGLLRIVLLLDSQQNDVSMIPFMKNVKQLGTKVNTVYFSQSKFQSKRIAVELKKAQKRSPIIYDADLPPRRRREVEKELNEGKMHGVKVLATSALELGVDIEGLDVCLIDEIPPSRADLLQRIGRVGRRVGQPGLILMRLSTAPHDQSILENTETAFQLDQTRVMPIPLHLEMLRWRHELAAFDEWDWAIDRERRVTRNSFLWALSRYFDETRPDSLEDRFREHYGALVDMNESHWAFKGFRATADGGKIPLKKGKTEVARIDNYAIFRDAHPEAVFLGHDLKRYRVTGYIGKWKIAKWNDPRSDFTLGKWLRTISAINVEYEKRSVTTRGTWRDRSDFYERITDLSEQAQLPAQGKFEYGIWEHTRTWQGYREINLRTGQDHVVPLGEITRRFKMAVERQQDFPFLHDLSFRTFGWEWDFGSLGIMADNQEIQLSLSVLTGRILEHFLAASVESKVDDISVELNLLRHCLHVLDATPGGNGLSEALLMEGRIKTALQNCAQMLARFRGKQDETPFKKYVLNLCHVDPSHSAAEVHHVAQELHMRWNG
jgi:superfamily II DNA/RNA helicase